MVVMVDRMVRHMVAMMMVVMVVVVDHVVVVMDRSSGHRRNRGETDNHRSGDQQFLKHSLSP